MLDGWTARYERGRRERAWVVANLMNIHNTGKEPITVDKLLGNAPDGKPVDMLKIRERAEQRRQERLAARKGV